jgi:hypothetical protein
LVAPFVSAGETVIATPLAGLVEFTVSTCVVGGGGVVVLMPPPQPVKNMLNPIPAAATHRKSLILILSFRSEPSTRPRSISKSDSAGTHTLFRGVEAFSE